MPKIKDLKVGQVLYSLSRSQMGKTMVLTTNVYKVTILEIDENYSSALVSWNGNRATRYYPRQIEKLRVKEPQMIRTAMGSQRPARRGEMPK